MYRANADYQHKPYKKYVSNSDILYTCTKVLIVLFTVLYLSVWATRQEVFQVSNIYINGTHAVSREEIKEIVNVPLQGKYLFLWKKNNKILYPKGAIEYKILSLNSKLSNVSISVSRKNIFVDVLEYEPSIRYCLSPLNTESKGDETLPNSILLDSTSTATSSIENKSSVFVPKDQESQLGLKEIPTPEVIEGKSHSCYWSDDKGYIFSESPEYIGLPILTVTEKDQEKSKLLLNDNSPIGKNIFGANELLTLNTIISLLKDSGLRVRQVLALPNNDISLDIGYPFMVTLNLQKDPADSIDHLLLALKELNVSSTSTETKVRFIDVRFSNKVFYR